MVSLQAESNYWFHYEPTYLSSNEYVGPPSIPSYPSIMITESNGDPIVENALLKHAPNSFTQAYISYPKRFSSSDRYTLFIPLQSPHMDSVFDLIHTPGFSFKDRELRVLGKSELEELLLKSMCPFRIHPFQLQGRHTSINTLFQPNTFYIDRYGTINNTHHIVSYIEFPHATLFFTDFSHLP
jgi:hypothetical protein